MYFIIIAPVLFEFLCFKASDPELEITGLVASFVP
jgi:hypothetical protein